MTGHLQGGKYGNAHTTVIAEAVGPAKAAHAMAGVSKVSLGIISKLPNGPVSLKFLDEGPCLLVKIRGRSSLQEIRVYTSNKQETERAMRAAL
jgi:hypothetical protein